MNTINRLRARPIRNASLSDREDVYLPPCIQSEMNILLEDNLLAGSVLYMTSIRTEGQESDGFFEPGSIVSEENPWLD